MKIDKRFTPDNINKVTGEYLYNKGFINGLTNAIGKSDTEIKALIDVYKIKTLEIDNTLFNSPK